jgi:hypothetical protein
MTYFVAGDPAHVFPGGVLLWGPGYPTPEAAAAQMARLAATQSMPLVLIEAVDFETAVRPLRAWVTPSPA